MPTAGRRVGKGCGICRSDSRRYQQLQLCQPSLPLCRSLTFPLSHSLFTLHGQTLSRPQTPYERASHAGRAVHAQCLTNLRCRPSRIPLRAASACIQTVFWHQQQNAPTALLASHSLWTSRKSSMPQTPTRSQEAHTKTDARTHAPRSQGRGSEQKLKATVCPPGMPSVKLNLDVST